MPERASVKGFPLVINAPTDGMRLPLVSVIITNFNYADFIEQALDSVASQKYPRWECIVVDDCSSDNSFELIQNWITSKSDSRFQCVRLDTNSGQLAASKAGFDRTSGQFVAFLDSDDMLLPDFIEKHVLVHLNSSYSAGLSASDMMRIDRNNNVIEGTFYLLHKKRGPRGGRGKKRNRDPKSLPADAIPSLSGDRLVYSQTGVTHCLDRSENYGWPYVATSGMMFRRAVLDLIFPANLEQLRLNADYYLAQYTHMISGSLIIPSAHSLYRAHGANGFSKHSVIGGEYLMGVFEDSQRRGIEKAISTHALDHFEILTKRIGIKPARQIAFRYLKRRDVYEYIRDNDALKRLVVKGGKLGYAIKRSYYRLRGK